MLSELLPAVTQPAHGEAVRFPDGSLTFDELRDRAAVVASQTGGIERVAVWVIPSIDTCVAVVGALLAGAAVVPLHPKLGSRELEHVVTDSAPDVLLAPSDLSLPQALTRLPRLDSQSGSTTCASLPTEPAPESPALVIYTSGTTGPPKGAVLSRKAIASNLDALAQVWEWTADDLLVHALPLFHAHGLVLGMLGPLRLGGRLHHLGGFSAEGIVGEFETGATMLFGVPTMYHRLAEAAGDQPRLGGALSAARLLVSGSAPLPVRDAERIEQISGQRVVERYGLTETLMICSMRVAAPGTTGTVGPPLPGVDLRLVDDDGQDVPIGDLDTIGEVVVRGPSLFRGYLNRPDATDAALRDGWFWTGDLATRDPDGSIRIVGRRATDLIKTGGYKVGAGEVEGALMEHPAVAEVAVLGAPDDDLGERIVAWVVIRDGTQPSDRELIDHVSAMLTPHKRPRTIRRTDALPRNELGKIQKKALR